MKKIVAVALIASLMMLAFIPTACSKVSAPVNYSSYTLQRVTFSYPTDWINGTADLEQSLAQDDPNYSTYMRAAGWYSPSDSAALFAMSIDLNKSGMPKDYALTESDNESIVASETGYMTSAMEQPTIVSEGKTSVDGHWAYQTEFSGKIEGVAAKGYVLTVISNNTVFSMVYAAQDNVWGSLKPVYDMAKSSIVMY